MPTNSEAVLVFTAEELDLLGRTADALSAYMGKPVLAEVIDAAESGFEWVTFAVPLTPKESEEGRVVVQIGGVGARIVGNQGGLAIANGEIYNCEYLWAIQRSSIEGVRFIKLDQEGDEVAWTDDLREILPFALVDEPPPDDDDDNDDDDGGNPDKGAANQARARSRK
ncbi:MAG: hypothetical protein ABI228_08460 [Burkholderiaceae bacterium]